MNLTNPTEAKRYNAAINALVWHHAIAGRDGTQKPYPLNDVQAETYLRGLEHLPIDAVEGACRRAIETLNWFPKLPELIQLAEGGTADDRATMAWLMLERGVSRFGGYGSVVFEDAAVCAAIEWTFGSWPALCVACDGTPGWAVKRKDFLVAYRRAVSVLTPAQRTPVMMPGRHAMHNGGHRWPGLENTDRRVSIGVFGKEFALLTQRVPADAALQPLLGPAEIVALPPPAPLALPALPPSGELPSDEAAARMAIEVRGMVQRLSGRMAMPAADDKGGDA